MIKRARAIKEKINTLVLQQVKIGAKSRKSVLKIVYVYDCLKNRLTTVTKTVLRLPQKCLFTAPVTS